MAERDSKRFYWLKLKKDFFQQHQIKVLKSLPNGRLYALIYLELLAESTSHEGELRFSQMLPYDTVTLSAVIDEDKGNVEKAIEILINLELIEILDDGTLFMREIERLIGSETGQTIRKREAKLGGGKSVVKNTLEYRDKSIDIRYKKEIYKERKFTPPTLDEVKQYCLERNNGVDAERFIDFYTSKDWFIGKSKMKDWKACVRTWERREKPTTEKIELTDNIGIKYDTTNNPTFTEEQRKRLANRRKYES